LGRQLAMTIEDTAPRVLIVDDDILIRALLASILKELGVEIVGEAANGREAIVAFSNLSPDLTLLDIQMPIKNGFDTLREIKRIDDNAEVVMLTANDDTVVAESCINAGARSYIKKGLGPDKLMPVLQSIFDSLELG
jgi:two-component system chemotaxis response regulator CheY